MSIYFYFNQQTFQDTFSYHNPLTKVPASYFRPTQAPQSQGLFGNLFNLVGLSDKSSSVEYTSNANAVASSKPNSSKGGIFSFLFGSKKDDVECKILKECHTFIFL